MSSEDSDSDTVYSSVSTTNKKDWACNNPTEDEIRYNNDSDLITSEDSSEEKNNLTKCKRYNQLLPSGKLVRKLLHSTTPDFNKLWRDADSKFYFGKKYTEYNTKFGNAYFMSSEDSDSDTVYTSVSTTNKKDWACNNPTEDEIRYNNDSDLITSEDSSEEKNNLTKCKRYNQLLPSGKLVRKLLHSTTPDFNKLWRDADSKFYFGKKYTEYNTKFGNAYFMSSEDSDSDTVYSSVSTTNKNKSSLNVKDSLESSTRSVNVEEIYTESESGTLLPRKMVKNHKRKHEDSSDEVESKNLKKIKSNETHIGKKVKRQVQEHDISHSEAEDSARPSTGANQGQSLNKPNRNSLNTHLLSSESDSEVELCDVNVNSSETTLVKRSRANGEGEQESSSSLENETNGVEETIIETSSLSESTRANKPLRRMPKFTQELNDEISKFSALLDENLIKKNDIWILQCPSNMDVATLVSQSLSLGGTCELDDGESTYEAYSYRNTNTRSATLAVPSERNRLDLRRIPIAGNIIVEEIVRATNNTRSSEIISEPPSRVEFPENLRKRHPLLGIDFSKQPRTVDMITQSVSKKKRHSKKHKHDESFNDAQSQVVVHNGVSSSTKNKKKKKYRSDEDVMVSDQTEQIVEESIGNSAKKKKKKKHKDNDSYDSWVGTPGVPEGGNNVGAARHLSAQLTGDWSRRADCEPPAHT